MELFTPSIIPEDSKESKNLPKGKKTGPIITRIMLVTLFCGVVVFLILKMFGLFKGSKVDVEFLHTVHVTNDAKELIKDLSTVRSNIGRAVNYNYNTACNQEEVGQSEIATDLDLKISCNLMDNTCKNIESENGKALQELVNINKNELEKEYGVTIDLLANDDTLKKDIRILLSVGGALTTISGCPTTGKKSMVMWRIQEELKRLCDVGVVKLSEIMDFGELSIRILINKRVYIMKMPCRFQVYSRHKSLIVPTPLVQETLMMFRSNTALAGFIVYEDYGIMIDRYVNRDFTLDETIILLKDIIQGYLAVYKLGRCAVEIDHPGLVRGILDPVTGQIIGGRLANFDEFAMTYSRKGNDACLRKGILTFIRDIAGIWDMHLVDFKDLTPKKYISDDRSSILNTRIPIPSAHHFFFTVNKLVRDHNRNLFDVIEFILDHPFLSGKSLTKKYISTIPEVKYLSKNESKAR